MNHLLRSILRLSVLLILQIGIDGNARANDDEAHHRAVQLLSLAGCSQGVCCVPRCGDGALATAIAQNSNMFVLARNARVSIEETPAYDDQIDGTHIDEARQSKLLSPVLDSIE